MKESVKRNVYILSFFVVFLVFIGFVIFLVLFESGIINLHQQAITVSSFSCSPSGTTINLYKNVEQPVNITKVVLSISNKSYSVLSATTINGAEGYYEIHLDYVCLLKNEAVSIKVYYQTYSYADNSINIGNNFFSSLISNTKA